MHQCVYNKAEPNIHTVKLDFKKIEDNDTPGNIEENSQNWAKEGDPKSIIANIKKPNRIENITTTVEIARLEEEERPSIEQMPQIESVKEPITSILNPVSEEPSKQKLNSKVVIENLLNNINNSLQKEPT